MQCSHNECLIIFRWQKLSIHSMQFPSKFQRLQWLVLLLWCGFHPGLGTSSCHRHGKKKKNSPQSYLQKWKTQSSSYRICKEPQTAKTEAQTWRPHTPPFQSLLQSDNNQNNVVSAQAPNIIESQEIKPFICSL